MNNVFDFKRFGKYFLYDFKSFQLKYMTSLLVTSLAPFLVYAISYFFTSLIPGIDACGPTLPARAICFFLIFLVVCMTYGAKTYGFITDKKLGSSWLMIPASTLEKFASMMLITFIVLPVFFVAVFLLSDALIVMMDPACGDSLWKSYSFFIGMINNTPFNFVGNGIPLFYLSFMSNIIIFLLGALIFKKKKVGAVILFYFIISSLTSTLFSVLAMGSDVDWVENLLKYIIANYSDNSISIIINSVIWVHYALYVVAPAIAIYFRIKTIKH